MPVFAESARAVVHVVLFPLRLFQGLSCWIAYPAAIAALIPVIDRLSAFPGGLPLAGIAIFVLHGWPELAGNFVEQRSRHRLDSEEHARATEEEAACPEPPVTTRASGSSLVLTIGPTLADIRAGRASVPRWKPEHSLSSEGRRLREELARRAPDPARASAALNTHSRG